MVNPSAGYQRWRQPEVVGHVSGAGAAHGRGKELMTAADVAAVRDQAYREGFAQGRKDGVAAGEIAARERALRLEQLLGGLARPLEDADEQVLEELMMTVMAVARHIIRREIKTDPGQVVAVIQKALQELPAASRHVKVYLHPDDIALVREVLAGSSEGEVSWSLHEDALVSPGGCRIETDTSEVDATVERRLAQIAAKLLGGDREGEQP